MEIGDKVIMKTDFVGPNGVYIVKGTLGRITYLDFLRELSHVEFGKTILKLTLQELTEFCQLVKNERGIDVPKSLMTWYNQTAPYIGGKND